MRLCIILLSLLLEIYDTYTFKPLLVFTVEVEVHLSKTEWLKINVLDIFKITQELKYIETTNHKDTKQPAIGVLTFPYT